MDRAAQQESQGLHQVEKSWSPYARMSAGTRRRLRSIWSSLGFNYDTASKLRYEADMLLLRAQCGLDAGFKRCVRDIASRKHLLVHLGCGNALLDGWINLDCYPPEPRPGIDILTLDLRQKWPFSDASVSALFSEHFLEHLPVAAVRTQILPEIFRVLEPGGSVRLAVPNGEYFIEQYIASKAGHADPLFEQHRHDKSPMTMLNEVSHGFGHYFLYDFQTFKDLLQEVGFVNVQRSQPARTDIACFKGLDRQDEWRMAMSLYVEAQSPSKPPSP